MRPGFFPNSNLNPKLRLFAFITLAGLGIGCDEIFDDSEIDRLSDNLAATIKRTVGAGGINELLLPEGNDLGAIPADPANPLTPEKVQLGRFLFHETAMAVRPVREDGFQQYSCASCHHARAGFQSGLKQGLAEGGVGFGKRGEERRRDLSYTPEQVRSEPIRPLATLNSAWVESAGWSGVYGATADNVGTEARWDDVAAARLNGLGYTGIETRSIEALGRYGFNPEALIGNSEYEELFDAAFPETGEEERIASRTAGLAIAAYLRTVTSSAAPFQKWLRGQRLSMGTSSLKGAILFFGKADCYTCHNGPSLGSNGYHALGMDDLSGVGVVSSVDQIDSVSTGRAAFTGRNEDRYRFRTPQLYNLPDAGLYGHGGSFRSLEQVVAYKNRARVQNPDVPSSALDSAFLPLELSSEEVEHLAAFLSDALRDPQLRRYEPDRIPSGNCFPNGDEETRRDLACR